MKHGDVSIRHERNRQKQVMPKCADAQVTMEMHRMLRTVPIVFIKKTLLQSCLDSKEHGNHRETQGKEILTKSVVLMCSRDSVRTRGSVSKLFLIEAHQRTNKCP